VFPDDHRSLSKCAISADGQVIAVASNEGIKFKVFTLKNGKLKEVREFLRSLTRPEIIQSLHLQMWKEHPGWYILTATSSSPTVQIFSFTIEQNLSSLGAIKNLASSVLKYTNIDNYKFMIPNRAIGPKFAFVQTT